jgi:hypothetical protein
MPFNEALQRYTSFLAKIGWPQQIVWVKSADVIVFPQVAVFVFRPQRPVDLSLIRARFEKEYGAAPAIAFHSVAFAEEQTYAFVEAIDQLGQGEHMFVTDRLKLSAASEPPPLVVVRSQLRWWWVNRQYRAWLRARDRALGAA